MPLPPLLSFLDFLLLPPDINALFNGSCAKANAASNPGFASGKGVGNAAGSIGAIPPPLLRILDILRIDFFPPL